MRQFQQNTRRNLLYREFFGMGESSLVDPDKIFGFRVLGYNQYSSENYEFFNLLGNYYRD